MALRIFRLIKNTLETIAESSFSFLSHVFITHLLHILARRRRFNICIFHLLLKKATVVAERPNHIFSQ